MTVWYILINVNKWLCYVGDLLSSNTGATATTATVAAKQHKNVVASRKMNADIKDEAGMARVAEATEKFSRSLYSAMVEDVGAADNLLVSPFSAAAVVAMAAAGARGDTAQQMWAGLGVPDTEAAEAGWSQAIPALRTNMYFILETANAAFVAENYKILDEYKESLHQIFHSDVSPVNFGDSVTLKRINSWVSDMTNKKIEKLVNKQDIPVDTIIVLVNAIYFKGDWVNKFNKKDTKKQEFYVSSGETVMVDMMRQFNKELPLAILDDIDSTMLELPYEGERIVMHILLPNRCDSGVAEPGSGDGDGDGGSETQCKDGDLKSIEEKIGDIDIAKIFEEKKINRKVHIQMPKFKSTHSSNLKEPLKSLGMTNMFLGGIADFSGMDGTRDLYVSFIKQMVAVEVNEEGSEAAAATALGGKLIVSATGPGPQMFNVDHPFIFYIRDKLTGMLLFQGRVVNPTL